VGALDQRAWRPGRAVALGGVKSSGIGRELGWAGIEASTEEKIVSITL
jgi:betaine-aldehyde dehydrogenase